MQPLSNFDKIRSIAGTFAVFSVEFVSTAKHLSDCDRVFCALAVFAALGTPTFLILFFKYVNANIFDIVLQVSGAFRD